MTFGASQLKALVRRWVYRLGLLSAWHARRNRRTLTVAMFHRVLPAADLARSEADPVYTMTTSLFDEVIAFMGAHYRLVSLEDVLAARRGDRPLPPRALLITFDDGWKDNHDHALPILRERGAPFTIFLASDPVTGQAVIWWQEVLLWALRSGQASFEELWRALPSDPAPCPEATVRARQLDLLMRYGTAPMQSREEILRPFTDKLRKITSERHMLDMAELYVLRQSGGALGAHGACHLPLNRLPDPEADLRRVADALKGMPLLTNFSCVSFPHGRYDATVLDAARRVGYQLLFTSDPVLTPTANGRLESDLIGRIEIAAHDIAGADGRLMPERLATWLFQRDQTVIDRDHSHA